MPKPICSQHPSRPSDHPPFPKDGIGSVMASEPTSPSVGHVKVRPSKAPPIAKSWLEALGLKKDVINFLGVLPSSLRFRFNMGCFGTFRAPVVECCSSEEEEEGVGGRSDSRTTISKWFMVLEEKQGKRDDDDGEEEEQLPPPKNALLLKRCRSAPAKRGEEVAVRKEEGDEERLMLMSYAPDFFKVSTDIVKKEASVVGSTVDPTLARSRSWSWSWRRH